MASFKDSVGVTMFNKKYKNRLKDFYTLGFKTDIKFYEKPGNKPLSTNEFYKDKKRITVALKGKTGVSFDNKDTSVSIDSRRLEYNPFFDIYRRCNGFSKIPGMSFLTTYMIAILLRDEKCRISGKSLNDRERKLIVEDVERYLNKFKPARYEKALREYYEDFIEHSADYADECDDVLKKFEAISPEVPELTKQMLFSRERLSCENEGELCFVESYTSFPKSFIDGFLKTVLTGDDSYNVDADLQRLCGLGLISEDESAVRQKKKAQTDSFSLKAKRKSPKLRYAQGRYRLPEFEDKELQERFYEMVRFYSETAPLGVIGHFILNRAKPFEKVTAFKHNYIQRALNSYNMIDILKAIKEERWVEIQYKIASKNGENTAVSTCLPITVRENTVDGRQYVVYYEPDTHSAFARRIDSIDLITYSNSFHIPEALRKEFENVKKLTDYVFGASLPPLQGGNASDYDAFLESLHTVELTVSYKPEEWFIPERFHKEINLSAPYVESFEQDIESVDGEKQIRLRLRVTDAHEVIKWARSFIRRIDSITVDGRAYEALGRDILSLDSAYNVTGRLPMEADTGKAAYGTVLKSTDDGFAVRSVCDGKGFYPHEKIFNLFFSLRMEELGRILVDEILENGENYVVCDDRQLIEKYVKREPGLRKDEDAELFIDQIFTFINVIAGSTHICKLEENAGENVYDIFPLTYIEVQWLHEILEDSKSELFLTAEERQTLKKLYPDLGEFSLSDVSCFNQYNCFSAGDTLRQSFYENKQAGEHLREIMRAIRSRKALDITYYGGYEGSYYPSHIEYSKRDDVFRVYTVSEEGLFVLNLERIKSCRLNEKLSFDINELRKKISAYVQAGKRCIKVQFRNHKNMPNRILAEFSPWEKKCEYNREKGIFTMTLYYDAPDSFEITVRLLAYGRDVYILSESDGGTVRDNLIKRIALQKQRDGLKKTEAEERA